MAREIRDRRAMAWRSKGKPLPARAPEPSGSTLMRARACCRRSAIAREHLEVGEQIMRPQHRLRPPQMRVARNHRIRILARPASAAPPADPASSRSSVSHAGAQLQPDVERNLFVAAAPGVDLVRQRADFFLQLADDERVDVFVVRAVRDMRDSALLLPISSKAAISWSHSSRGQNALRCQSARKRLRAFYVREDQLADRSAASPKIAQRLRKARFRICRPTVS